MRKNQSLLHFLSESTYKISEARTKRQKTVTEELYTRQMLSITKLVDEIQEVLWEKIKEEQGNLHFKAFLED